MATLTATRTHKPPIFLKVIKNTGEPVVNAENDECPICKAANYRLRPDVEEAIERSYAEGLNSYKNADEMFKALGI
jgi:hypothetical protein